MSQFSCDTDVDGICLPCQEGNMFYLGNPDGVSLPAIRGLVGGQSTPALPMSRMEILPNTVEGTTQRVELDIGGQTRVIAPGADAFGQCTMPGQLQVHMGVAPPVAQATPPAPPPPFVPDPAALARARGETGSMVPIGQYSSARQRGDMGMIRSGHEENALDVRAAETEDDFAVNRARAESELQSVCAFEMSGALGAPPGGEQSVTFEEVSVALAQWLTHGMGGYFRNVGGALISVTDALASGNNMRFLREVGFQRVRLFRLQGVWMAGFTGSRLLRTLVRGTTAGAPAFARMKVTLLDAAIRSPGANAAAGVRSVASRGGAIGIAFVSAMDVAAYFSQHPDDRVPSDLLADLGFSFATESAPAHPHKETTPCPQSDWQKR